MRNCFKMKLFFFFLIVLSVCYTSNSKQIEITKDFTMFTSKNLAGYLKPLFTTVEESFNSNMYTRAIYGEHWTIGLDISAMGMLIPSSQKKYDAELPDMYGNTQVVQTAELTNNSSIGGLIKNNSGRSVQPTIYGGESFATYSAPQTGKYPDTLYKSLAHAEGNDISLMSGIPIIQLVFGAPTRTQLRFRLWGAPIQDETLWYVGFIVNQQVDHWFKLFKEEDDMGLSLNLAYHNVSRDGIGINSWAVGAHFSKTWENWFTAYGGLQYEDMSGTFEATKIKDDVSHKETVDSPYPEIRNIEPIKFDIETFSSFRICAGASARWKGVEFHLDGGYVSQPYMSIGVTFYIAEIGKKEKVTKLEKIEKIEKIERIEKREINEQ